MKRITRRTIGAVIGLSLGWYVYGVVDPILSGKPSFAHEDKAAHQAAPAGHAERGKHPAEEDSEHVAGHLVPADGGAPFIRPVIYAAVGLFVAAIVLGIPAQALRGPEPPDPAEQHEAHGGHDEHDHGGEHAHP